jgi:hypothetical protein
MTTVEALVQGYYGRSDLLQRIEARLRKAGVDPQKPGFRDLHPPKPLPRSRTCMPARTLARAACSSVARMPRP